MSGPPRFGTSLPAIQQIPSRVRPWEREVGGSEILAAARAAEAAGFDWVSCSDHPLVPVSRAEAMGPTWYDAGSTLAFVAGVTARIPPLEQAAKVEPVESYPVLMSRLGVDITQLPKRRRMGPALDQIERSAPDTSSH